ncbi:DUF4350 domain-containing protein [soil metagenome]
MSAPSTEAPSPPAATAPAGDASPADGSPADGSDPVGHRVRRWVLWIGAVLVLMLVFTYIAGLAGSSDKDLDPDNPHSNGMQALAQVLDDQGVSVEVARGVEELPGDSAQGATVMVVTTDYLSPSSGQALLDYSQDASSLVVLSPTDTLQATFDIDATVVDRLTTTPMSPECAARWWAEGERVTHGDALIDIDQSVPADTDQSVTTCVPPSAGFNAGGSQSGYLVELDQGDNPPIILAGLSQSWTNQHILNEANAATSLRVLGQSDRLIWLIPSISDAGDLPARGLFDVLPDAVAPAMVLFVCALGMLALVMGRRLGPVSTEPLPVVIRAIETTVSRGRLYAEARDRSRALASLQLASRRRLATRLGLAARAEPEDVVAAVARATGRRTDDIRRLLADARVDDDSTLVAIARDVRALEEGTIST